MQNVLTLARRQVTEVVLRCQLHKSVENEKIRLFW